MRRCRSARGSCRFGNPGRRAAPWRAAAPRPVRRPRIRRKRPARPAWFHLAGIYIPFNDAMGDHVLLSAFSRAMSLRMGVDLGGTKIELAVFDGEWRERLRRRIA